jgi:UDPglucose 6-dehydrogenase
LTSDLLEVADDVDVICVFTEWPEFAKVDLDTLAARVGKGTTIVDTRNLFDPDLVKNAGLRYDGVGRT